MARILLSQEEQDTTCALCRPNRYTRILRIEYDDTTGEVFQTESLRIDKTGEGTSIMATMKEGVILKEDLPAIMQERIAAIASKR